MIWEGINNLLDLHISSNSQPSEVETLKLKHYLYWNIEVMSILFQK